MRNKKTSADDPLRIAAVESGVLGLGRVGVTFCPGKYDPHGGQYDGGTWWDRDLGLDLDRIREWGAAALVTLLQPSELTMLRVECLGDEVARRSMLWFHLPIDDGSIPDEDFERRWQVDGEKLRAMLRSGLDVVVHCRGGLGRAGTIAARLLVELGLKPKKAIKAVRAARGPYAIENSIQEEYVLNIRSLTE